MPLLILALALSYLAGSIPTGLWLGLWLRGVDIRQHGSQNIGATNTLRVLGRKLGAVALLGDMGKGILAVLIFSRLTDWPYAPLACGLAAILGHSASIFLRFSGGKGVATGGGVFLALAPIPTLVAAGTFFAVFRISRMVSAGSIVASVTLVVAVLVLPHGWATYPTHSLPSSSVLAAAAAAVAGLVIWKHRANIRRILAGTENKI